MFFEKHLIILFIFHLFQGHSSFIKHLDWSEDSQILRSNSGDYEILYCKNKLGKSAFFSEYFSVETF